MDNRPVTAPDPALVGEIVPLTEEDIADITDAWRAHCGRESPQTTETTDVLRRAQAYFSTLARILSAHGFDPSGGVVTQSAETPLVLRGRRR